MTATPTPPEFDLSRRAIGRALRIPVAALDPGARLLDLDFDSLDIVEAAMALEDAHAITIDDAALDAITLTTATVGDLHALAVAALAENTPEEVAP